MFHDESLRGEILIWAEVSELLLERGLYRGDIQGTLAQRHGIAEGNTARVSLYVSDVPGPIRHSNPSKTPEQRPRCFLFGGAFFLADLQVRAKPIQGYAVFFVSIGAILGLYFFYILLLRLLIKLLFKLLPRLLSKMYPFLEPPVVRRGRLGAPVSAGPPRTGAAGRARPPFPPGLRLRFQKRLGSKVLGAWSLGCPTLGPPVVPTVANFFGWEGNPPLK